MRIPVFVDDDVRVFRQSRSMFQLVDQDRGKSLREKQYRKTGGNDRVVFTFAGARPVPVDRILSREATKRCSFAIPVVVTGKTLSRQFACAFDTVNIIVKILVIEASWIPLHGETSAKAREPKQQRFVDRQIVAALRISDARDAFCPSATSVW